MTEITSSVDKSWRVTTRDIWRMIDGLKETIAYQTELIQSTKDELLEVKHDQNVLQTQNEKLHEEVRALRAQIDALPSTPVVKSWAAVAASHPPLQPNHQHIDKDRNCVRISTQRSFIDPRDNDMSDQNNFGRYLLTETANTHIQSAEAARNNSEWLNELGNNTKLVKLRFGVVVHRTPIDNFNLENVNAQAIEKIIEENELTGRGFQIEEIAWLKKKDKALGKFASLGIWFDTAEGTDFILENGFIVGQRFIGSVERYELKRKRCFRCQRFGHFAWSCKETPRCGHCASQHERERCPPGLNIMKSGPRMEALINDHQSQDLDILLIQEPSITTYQTHVNHSAWRLYRPITETDAGRFRSLIYINRKVSTSSHRQIAYNHPDVTAIKIWIADSQFLMFSEDQRITTVILLDTSELINFFQTHGLHGYLPRGIAIFWPLNDPGKSTTIDQTVTNRPELLIKCHLYHENYGSDHRVTYSEWNLSPRRQPAAKAKKAYDRADWAKIAEDVLRQIGLWKGVKTRPALDEVVERLIEATTTAVDRYTPDLRPSLYSKRWFTPDLKIQQTEVNYLRRKWQESYAELGRHDARSTTLFQEMQQKRRIWTRTIEKKQFLDEAGEGKLWKAAIYTKPREAWGCIPALHVATNELTENKEKAQAFLDAFFPKMDEPDEDSLIRAPLELPWQPITELEI
ncbi:uncharacterized protein N7525_004661 [Penicillium rubens]|uniref:uncharacterized protein n=1 Tax=Penicillium rubens TaxID=1108849 RepID=UPI002A5A93A0|nr:uncharacterized protein N7525_004661 [Penicillium rubens]KAJ5839473.1 hypothetical protein N7525_004661 [Penicillium rubens]